MTNLLFKNKYRIPSTRLVGYDYSQPGFYFVTLCTKNRKLFFGSVIDGNMNLSKIGVIAKKCWEEIPNHFPFVTLDEFVIMPNHVHGILQINGSISNMDSNVETQNLASPQSPQTPQSPQSPQSLQFPLQLKQQYKNKFGPQSKNLSSIIRGFKIGVTKFTNDNRLPFGWQPRYHDRIIRTKDEYNRIKQYIINNPSKWGKKK